MITAYYLSFSLSFISFIVVRVLRCSGDELCLRMFFSVVTILVIIAQSFDDDDGFTTRLCS